MIVYFYNDILGKCEKLVSGQFEHNTGKTFELVMVGLNANGLK